MPGVKTIVSNTSWGRPVVYYSNSGAVTFRISDQGNDADNIALFNMSKNTAITELSQLYP